MATGALALVTSLSTTVRPTMAGTPSVEKKSPVT
jgi:hypothetical protein